MRTSLALRLTGLSFLALFYGYIGWAHSVTLGNPVAVSDMTHSVLRFPAVQETLQRGSTPWARSLLQSGVESKTAEAIVATAIRDPRVAQAIAQGVERVHQDLISGSPAIQVDIPGEVITSASRDAAARHGVDPTAIGEIPTTALQLPATPTFGWWSRITSWWPRMVLAGGVLALVSLAIADRRDLVLGRLGRRVALSAGTTLMMSLFLTWAAAQTTSPVLTTVAVVLAMWRAYTQPVLVAALVIGSGLWLGSSFLGRTRSIVAFPNPVPPQAIPCDPPTSTGLHIPLIDARGRPVAAMHHPRGQPDHDPWVDGPIRGGRFGSGL